MTKLQRLEKLSKEVNIADKQDNTFLTKLADDVIRNYEADDGSRADWLKRSKFAMDHAMQVVEQKDTPFIGASNVKYPLLTVAALQFHARAYPEIVKDQQVVKPKYYGKDPNDEKYKRAKRVSDYLNYQIFEEMPEWDEQTDAMILALAVEGCEFKKSYFDPTLGRNVSEWVRPKNIVVNNNTKSLEVCPRVTHTFSKHPYEIVRNQRSGVWLDIDLKITKQDSDDETLQEILEQHTILDLDNDGLKEPYIVTVHKDSGQVVRIKADYMLEDVTIHGNGQTVKIKELLRKGFKLDELISSLSNIKIVSFEKFQHFTKIPFIPSPDGSFYDIGFGQITGPLTDVVDTTINQLIDAGTIQNLGGGFIRKGMNINSRRGEVKFKLGEYKEVDIPSSQSIRDMIMPMQFGAPSPALFNLLGTMIQGVKEITSVQNIFTGGPQTNETATTTMARVEQGLKVFTAIYKRVLRGLGKEFQALYKLNSKFLNPETYFRVLDDNTEQIVLLKDFNGDGTDIRPVADPTESSTVHKQAKAQLIRQEVGNPIVNSDEAMRRYFEAIGVENIDKLIVPADKRNQPSPEMIKLQMDILDAKAQAAKTDEEAKRVRAEVILTYAHAIESIANAEAKEQGTQLAIYQQRVEDLMRLADGQRASKGMDGSPGNSMAPQDAGSTTAAMPTAGNPSDGQQGAGGGQSNPAGIVQPGQG